MASKFLHLHTHSHYSLLSALPKIDELVDQAKKYEMSALALTDNGNMYGAIEFYKTCKKAGIKPIIGVDFYVAARARTDKQAGVDSRRTRLILLAKDMAGYKSLVQLVTKSHMDGFYYKPRIDRELIEKYHEGLICISPSIAGEVTSALKMADKEKAKALIDYFKKVYGADNFYLEITHHTVLEGHESAMKSLIEVARETNTPLVAAHDTYYLAPEDKDARRVLTLVNTNEGAERSTRDDDEEDFSFISPEKAEELFKDTPEALENTLKIAEKCNLELTLGKWLFPNYIVESGRSYDDELKTLAYNGIKKRGVTETPELLTRLEYELKVIKDKGYAQYFLVVSDLLRFAHENHILTTIRGSVAGSLVTYLSGITNVDPLEYKLPFERFLNPERPSAPDIDMDYADTRRDEVIEYARKKYGYDKVAQIGTFGTMMARGAVRDVTRAMGYGYDLGDKISKLIPMGAQGFPMTIDRALDEVAELKKMYKDNAETKIIIDMAKKIEGCARHISVHAAGVVIGPQPLTEYVPLQYDTKGDNKIITQYDMHGVGEDGMGLLKFDFLGIRNLSILADAVDRVKKIDNIDVDIENVPIADTKTFEMLARGETIGLFQLNGSGMTRFLKELKPSSIHDINAMVALYRPGPMESIPQYIERKHDPEKVRYLDPRMKDILDRSFGVITYQDDVMMIAIKLGGYSWLEADKLRKAMGKKIPKEMEEQKGKLKQGLLKNGMSAKKADELWKLIEPFAAYGFNKAHAASYGRVAYQTAYMKANFPAIYMSAVLTADSGDIEKIAETITECKRMGIPVLPPDINESFSQFTIIKGEEGGADRIRFGLVTIKNFGQGAATAIIDERKRGGKFTSLISFLERVKDKNINKKSLEALIKAGALDALGERGKMLGNIEALLAYSKERIKASDNQDSLFGLMTDTSSLPSLKLVDLPPASASEKLAWEKELLGLYITGHPLDKYRAMLDKREITVATIKANPKEDQIVIIGGLIEELRPIVSKKGDPMLFMKLTDFTGTIEVVVFPKVFAEFRGIFVAESCVAIKGKVSLRNGEVSLLAEKLKRMG
ncbi:MAG: hypothetical protein RLZZ347_487 [Candidatus Parcubacteria bacterium]|jgi:DNA polymerase-3 subunit alpha